MNKKMESFSSNDVETLISNFEEKCSSILNELRAIDTEVNEIIQNIGVGAIYGEIGNKLLQVWENDCSIFQNYDFIFRNWVISMKSISKNYGSFVNITKSFYGGSGSVISKESKFDGNKVAKSVGRFFK